MPLSVAYLVNQYPAVSHTFIKREIEALERRGVTVERFALRGWLDNLVDAGDLAERERTRYVLQQGAARLLLALARCAVTRPRNLWGATRLALQMSSGSDRPLVAHLAYLAEACLLRQWLADAGVAHLHAHFATNPAEVALLVHALGGPPYSFTAHGSDIMDRPAQMALGPKVSQARFVAAVCSFGRNQLYRWVAHGLWAKVAVVGCGLQAGYGEGSTAPGAQHRRLVCVGRLSKEKGQLLLIEAAARLQADGVPMDILLVGDGPMRSEIEQLIAHHGLGAQVRLAGLLDSQGIEDALQQARALVVSSLSEGLPVVIMEAMAHRRPVIAPCLSGIPELVVHGKTGWLYPASDVAALAQAMRQCLDTAPDALAGFGEQAHRAVWAAHDADVEAGKLLALMTAETAATPPLGAR